MIIRCFHFSIVFRVALRPASLAEDAAAKSTACTAAAAGSTATTTAGFPGAIILAGFV